MTAAVRIFMRALDLSPALVHTHVGDQVKQGIFEFWCVIHGKVATRIVDDTVGRASAVGFLDQETVDCHLENVRVIRRFGGAPGLDLDRDDLAFLFDQVIRLAGQEEVFVEERLFQLPPGARIGVDDPSAGQAGGASLPA